MNRSAITHLQIYCLECVYCMYGVQNKKNSKERLFIVFVVFACSQSTLNMLAKTSMQHEFCKRSIQIMEKRVPKLNIREIECAIVEFGVRTKINTDFIWIK